MVNILNTCMTDWVIEKIKTVNLLYDCNKPTGYRAKTLGPPRKPLYWGLIGHCTCGRSLNLPLVASLINCWLIARLLTVLGTERQCVHTSKIKNGGLHQYGAKPFEQQHFKTAGVEGVNNSICHTSTSIFVWQIELLTPSTLAVLKRCCLMFGRSGAQSKIKNNGLDQCGKV